MVSATWAKPSVEMGGRIPVGGPLPPRFGALDRRCRQLSRWRAMLRQAGAVAFPRIGLRLFDIAIAGVLLAALAPVVVALLFLTGTALPKLVRTPRIGRWFTPFQELRFSDEVCGVGTILRRLRLHRYPTLWSVLMGDIAVVGPRAASPGEFDLTNPVARKRFDTRPGLVSLWWVRSMGNVAYGHELEADEQFLWRRGFRYNVLLTLRALVSLAYGGEAQDPPATIRIQGIPIRNVTMAEAVDEIVGLLDRPGSSQVSFLNAHCANLAHADPTYEEVLRASELTLADGSGLKLAGMILRQRVRQNVNGTDLFPRLLEALEETGSRVFLLGARPGVPERVRAWIEAEYPGVTVAGHRNGYFAPEEADDVVREIASSGADLLLVALGAPRQDLWVREHLEATGARVGMGVGGLFDFFGGQIPRAPEWMREMGLEWIYRLYQEPGRMWRRYLVGNAVFLGRVLRARITETVRSLGKSKAKALGEKQ